MRNVSRRDFGEVDAADAHDTLVGPVESREQLAQGRLAAAGGADERDHLTGCDVDVAVLQHRHAGDVPVLERFGVDVERPAGEPVWIHGRGFGRGLEHAVDAIEGDDRTGHLLEQEAHDAHRERQQREQGHRLHEFAR